MILQIVLFVIDVLLLNIAFLLSFLLRYGVNIPALNFQPYKDNFPFLTFVYMSAFIFTKVFKRRFSSYWDLFKRLFGGLFLGTLFGIALVYVFRIKWSSFPSCIFVISFPVALLLIFMCNGMFLRLRGKIKKKIVIIGRKNSFDAVKSGPLIEKKHVDKIDDLMQQEDIDEILIYEPVYKKDDQLNLLIYLLLKLKVNVVFSPPIYTELLSKNMMGENSVQFLRTFIGRKSDYEEFLLRALDVFCSVFVLVLFGPFILLFAAMVKISSKGPLFYKQTRVGKDGKLFTLYKFRTMIEDAEKQTGPVLAEENDPRVTKIGRFLRTTRIDEIPQLFNVIRGHMSLVGPRPERPYFIKRHKTLRELRLAVKPGLTGLAQIRSFYDLRPKHKIKYDYLYIQRRSLLLNLYILLRTIPIVLSKRGW